MFVCRLMRFSLSNMPNFFITYQSTKFISDISIHRWFVYEKMQKHSFISSFFLLPSVSICSLVCSFVFRSFLSIFSYKHHQVISIQSIVLVYIIVNRSIAVHHWVTKNFNWNKLSSNIFFNGHVRMNVLINVCGKLFHKFHPSSNFMVIPKRKQEIDFV